VLFARYSAGEQNQNECRPAPVDDGVSGPVKEDSAGTQERQRAQDLETTSHVIDRLGFKAMK